MQEEFAVGDQRSQKISEGRGPPDWDSLLEPCPFFQMFKNYLQVRASEYSTHFISVRLLEVWAHFHT